MGIFSDDSTKYSDEKVPSDGSYQADAENQKNAMLISAAMDAAVATALALWKRSATSSITNYQSEIAKRQAALAEAVHEHAKEFWPQEQSLLADAFGLGYNDPQYSALSNSWANYSDDSHDAYLKFLKDDLACRCLSISDCEKSNWKRMQQKDRAQMIYYADRQAENRADALNDYRYALQYAALGVGKNRLQTLPQYWKLAGQAGEGARTILNGAISNAYDAYGFYKPDIMSLFTPNNTQAEAIGTIRQDSQVPTNGAGGGIRDVGLGIGMVQQDRGGFRSPYQLGRNLDI